MPDQQKKEKKIDVIAIQSKVWLNTEELIEYTGLSRSEIHRLRIKGTNCAGTIPYAKIGGKVRFRRTEVDKWMEKHTVREAI
ncbi:helix-turn-helix domain-containing protein [Draconibacterium sp.]|uniref:helix-turn-helix domain-containing protein n=1 Tax=Draconibacterium sp. TaxID=1965318 RepID=UPI003568EDA7